MQFPAQLLSHVSHIPPSPPFPLKRSLRAVLRAAQQLLQARFPELCAYRRDWRTYMDCVRRCKLYDYAEHAWLDFRGQVTARVPLAAAAS